MNFPGPLKTKLRLLVVFFGFLFLISGSFVSAESTSEIVNNRRAELEQDLATLEKEIEAQRTILSEKQRGRVTLERDLAILDAKIEKSKLSIKAMNLVIGRLKGDIGSRETTISSLEAKIGREKDALAQLLRKTNEMDAYSLQELLLANQTISDFFSDLDSFDSIQSALAVSYTTLAANKTATEAEKVSLEGKLSEETELRKIQELERRRLEEQENEKKRIISATKGVESNYQKIIAEKEKSAAEIRAELFNLRGGSAIPFEKALQHAITAGEKTGVRPAFILGIIAEESNLGENVGTGNWRVDMKAPRDTVPFMKITSELGLNPDSAPVSKKPWYGWGGAMGPAQFIPSTWVIYQERIAEATGHNPPNPWDPGDAFTASALLLADNGADKGGYAAERLAALRYLAGWANAAKPAYAFYGDDVMDLAAKYQRQIDILNAN